MDKVQVFLSYNGEWKIDQDSIHRFDASSIRGVNVPKETTYVGLLDIIYHAIGVEKNRYDLVIQAKYYLPCVPTSRPTLINEDMDVSFFLDEILNSTQHRTPLCISLVEKTPLTIPTQESLAQVVNPTQESLAEPLNPTQDSIPVVVPEIVIPDQFSMFEHLDKMQDELFVNEAEDVDEEQCLQLNEVFTRSPITRSMDEHDQHFGSAYVGIDDPLPTEDYAIGLEVSAVFDSKKELQLRLHKYALANHFQFRVNMSRKGLWYVKCLDKTCKWRLRAVKRKNSDMFEIRTFEKKHTCSIVMRQNAKKQTPAWVIGDCIKSKYMDHRHDHLPKKIMEDMHTTYGVKINYNKAWMARERALITVRGTVEDSYGKLPSYFYMLEKYNPGTITDIQTDEHGHFRYMFMSLGVSIKGFKTCIRPVLCVDASFLKHKVGGQLLVAIALDANEQLYPVAFGVVDSESNNSWTYFMQKLKETIGEVQDLVFVSDRHPSIAHALSEVFPEAHHGACTYHIKMNIMAKFKTDNCHIEFDLASRAYTFLEFNRHFQKISAKNPLIAAYLEEIGFEKWSRAFFPGKRYNVMTSNYTESYNSQCRDARKYPITTLADYLRFTLQDWFNQRRELSTQHTDRLSQRYEKFIRDQSEKSRFYNVHQLNGFEFHVHDGVSDFTVDFRAKSCSCRVFDVSGLPCTHALAAARSPNLDSYDFCSRYYSTELWMVAYAETVYPVCNEDTWDVPEYIKQRVCLKPPVKVKKGRPKTKRRKSQGEPNKVKRRCGSCGGQGHNRATCSAVMPAPSTVGASTSTQQHITHLNLNE